MTDRHFSRRKAFNIIKPQERDQSKVLFEQLCYSYNGKSINNCMIVIYFMDYFHKNWYAIRNEWVVTGKHD
ncbi:protein FAR1-RELATED SEQUENCE 12-like [Aphis craccivora]|uniref:Protein FAR1-RELATED SEQUENCE 12-like n=1 Tax=Aphis craccivora TaxID=307492 RepID=A0A6G0Y8E9_APHCR|nr:protein FAR1-RELATED SEQUENCE 12-like [Aphis craccivora]